MNIGEKIRVFRLQQHMTQEKLAAEVHVSYQAVSKWERGESRQGRIRKNPCVGGRYAGAVAVPSRAYAPRDGRQGAA